MREARHTASGFTLIEMVIVSAIVALLAAVLLPSLGRVRQQAARVECASNLRQLGDSLYIYRTELGRYPLPGDRNPVVKLHNPARHLSGLCSFNPCGDRWTLYNIGDLAEALVRRGIRPEALFCPSSLQRDPAAPKPFRLLPSGYREPRWKTGSTSYIYLSGIAMPFEAADGQPTYHPAVESPDRALNRANNRAVLVGDRTVEIKPGSGFNPGTNHEQWGGHFAYTTGDVAWHNGFKLIPHPAPKTYIWYWPKNGSRHASISR